MQEYDTGWDRGGVMQRRGRVRAWYGNSYTTGGQLADTRGCSMYA